MVWGGVEPGAMGARFGGAIGPGGVEGGVSMAAPAEEASLQALIA